MHRDDTSVKQSVAVWRRRVDNQMSIVTCGHDDGGGKMMTTISCVRCPGAMARLLFRLDSAAAAVAARGPAPPGR
jgi:hypothetical protein